jgi:biopolymer transport protein ExbD
MAFGGFNDNNKQAPMSEINVTPMVDVMLVLLVIFIITAPMFTHAIKLDLPNAQSAPAPEKPETISLSINPAGAIYWNNDAISDKDLDAKLAAAAQVMATAQTNGLTKIGFVTDAKEIPTKK